MLYFLKKKLGKNNMMNATRTNSKKKKYVMQIKIGKNI